MNKLTQALMEELTVEYVKVGPAADPGIRGHQLGDHGAGRAGFHPAHP